MATPKKKVNKELAPSTLPENKESVNVANDAAALVDNTPGRSNELPPQPAPQAPIAAAHAPELASKGRGRPRLTDAEKAARKANRPQAPGLPPSPDQKPRLQPEYAARMVNQAYESTLVAFLGEDGALNEGEKVTLDTSLAAYMALKNFDLPPGMALAFAYATVTVAKLQKPKPKERAAAIFTAIKLKIANLRNRNKIPTAKPEEVKNGQDSNSSS